MKVDSATLLEQKKIRRAVLGYKNCLRFLEPVKYYQQTVSDLRCAISKQQANCVHPPEWQRQTQLADIPINYCDLCNPELP
jgi:hypothetical protein